MEKKYLLLRNNIEMGPFTLAELLRQRLRPTDLVWVEDKSLAWAYPTEIDEIKASLIRRQEEPEKGRRRSAFHPSPKAKRFHRQPSHSDREAAQAPPVVSLPAYVHKPTDEIERKAEELRQKVLSFEAGPSLHPRMPDGPEPSRISLIKIADEIDFVYHRRSRAVSASQVLVAGMVGVMLVVGWYGRPLLNAKKDTANSVATKLVSTEEHKAVAASKEKPQPTQQAQSLPADSAKGSDSSLIALQALPVKPKISAPEKQDMTVTAASFAASDSGLARGKEERTPTEEDTTAFMQGTGAPIARLEKKEPETTVPMEEVEEEPAERKRGLGQAIKSIFRSKKKKDRDHGSEDSIQAEAKDTTQEQ